MKKFDIAASAVKVPVDYILTALAWIAAYELRLRTDALPLIDLPTQDFIPQGEYLDLALIASGVLVILMNMSGAYRMGERRVLIRQIGDVLISTAALIMLVVGYFFVTREFFFSRLVLGYAWLLMILFLSLGRLILAGIEIFLKNKGIGRTRVLLIGSGEMANLMYLSLKKDKSYQVAGALDKKRRSVKKGRVKLLGDVGDLEAVVQKYNVDELILAHPEITDRQELQILNYAREHQLRYRYLPSILEAQQRNIDVAEVAGVPVLEIKPTSLDGWGRVYKRLFDFWVAALALIILSPFLLVIGLVIKLTSSGPVLFAYHKNGAPVLRVGQRGRHFHFFKFRSMVDNAHALRAKMVERYGNERAGGPMVKIKNDPRITRVGRFLRRSSLDELPQLWSVIKGDMSLVGPRPHLPEEVAKYERHHRYVLAIKPGMTGLAQVSGRSDLDFEEEVRLDTSYIQNWSLLKDIAIIIKTVAVVLWYRHEE